MPLLDVVMLIDVLEVLPVVDCTIDIAAELVVVVAAWIQRHW